MTDIDDKALELALAQLNKQFGKGSVIRLGDDEIEAWPAISTGAYTLDLALGIKGLPLGRIVEIYGAEASGKTTVALSVVAEAQRQGGLCAYIDAEHAIDPVYAQALGVNMDDLLFSQPNYGEMALDILEALVRTKLCKVIVLDSVANLIPKAELEGNFEQSHVGQQARMMARAMRKVVGPASEAGTLVIFINQIRHKIGVMFGNPETTPGGMALRYGASMRLDLRKKEDVKDTAGELAGVKVIARVKKNKMAPPLRVAEFDILYGRGINNLGCIFDLAVDKGILEKKGAWFNYKGEVFAQGRAKGIERLAEDLDFTDKIKEMIENGTE